MDERFRKAERQWQRSGDNQDFAAIIDLLLRWRSLRQWESQAERGDSVAERYIEPLRERVYGSRYAQVRNSEIFVNVYEDFTARSSLSCYLDEVIRIRRWLRQFYTNNAIFYQGRSVYDLHLEQDVQDPPAQILIEHGEEPCFRADMVEEAERRGLIYDDIADLETPAMIRRLTPINQWGQRDHYVSLVMVDSFEESGQVPEGPQTQPLPHWINIYDHARHYGGPEEGGWYFTRQYPIASLYVGSFPAVVDLEESPHFQESPLIGIDIDMERIRPSYFATSHGYAPPEVPNYVEQALKFLVGEYDLVTDNRLFYIETHPAVIRPQGRVHYE